MGQNEDSLTADRLAKFKFQVPKIKSHVKGNMFNYPPPPPVDYVLMV